MNYWFFAIAISFSKRYDTKNQNIICNQFNFLKKNLQLAGKNKLKKKKHQISSLMIWFAVARFNAMGMLLITAVRIKV